MRTDTLEDPWLLPTHQADFPSREHLPESRLHGRREGTFLALAAVFLLAAIAAPVLGASRVIDLGPAFGALVPDRELMIELYLPLGAVVVPLGFVAIALVCEVYGRRRASALVWIGVPVTLVMTGLARITDNLGGDESAFPAALGFTALYLAAHVGHLLVFDAMRWRARGRRLWLRALIAPVVGAVLGWVAFSVVVYGVVSQQHAGADVDAIAALAAGGLAVCAIAAVVLTAPVVGLARLLAVYLRVGRGEPIGRPATARVHGGVSERRAVKRSLIQPFNSAEMRFFAEGEDPSQTG